MKVKDLPDTIHGFSTKEILESLLLPVRLHSNGIIDLSALEIDQDTFPLIEKFTMKLYEKLDHKPSPLYRLMTGSPISYRIMPESIRSKMLKTRMKTREVSFVKMDLEKIRKKFLKNLEFEEINEDNNICLLTHDIESEKGLKRALRLKEIEEKYHIESTWFVCTEEYKLDKKVVKRLAENGEISSHANKHDGKFPSLGKEKTVEQLRKSKHKLEEIVEKEIYGFRAPLLQYNGKLLEAIGEAKFKYDSSVPTWEPMHPLTMKSDGIELINPIIINGMLEIPITLPQDHQMLHILGLSSKQTVKQWIRLMNDIEQLRGISVLLIHPDYELANKENIEFYANLLESITNVQTLDNFRRLFYY